jgi:protein required for attachment to host cells
MERRNWVVVANAARARVLEAGDGPARFTHVADLVHPQSRLKGVQLAALKGGDRAGHVEGTGHGPGSAAYEPRTDPRERERDRFAREVAQAINDGVARGRCAGVTLVAPDPFLGHVKGHLDAQARKALLRTLPSDMTMLSEDDLVRRLHAG